MTATITPTVSTPVTQGPAGPAARLLRGLHFATGVAAVVASAALLAGCATQTPAPPSASVQVAMVGSTSGLLAPDPAIQDDSKGCPTTAGGIRYKDNEYVSDAIYTITYVGASPHGQGIPGWCLESIEHKTKEGVVKIRTVDSVFGIFAGSFRRHFLHTEDIKAFANGMALVLIGGVKENEFYYHANIGNSYCLHLSYEGSTPVGNGSTDNYNKYKAIVYLNECYGIPTNAAFLTYKLRPDGPLLIAIKGDTWDAPIGSSRQDFSVQDTDPKSLGEALVYPHTGRLSAPNSVSP